MAIMRCIRGNLCIDFFASEASLSGNCKLIIFGSRGREVIKIAIKKQITNIETISLPAGTYMYHLYSNDTKIQIGKLVSNN
jgi:hypothetical protein